MRRWTHSSAVGCFGGAPIVLAILYQAEAAARRAIDVAYVHQARKAGARQTSSPSNTRINSPRPRAHPSANKVHLTIKHIKTALYSIFHNRVPRNLKLEAWEVLLGITGKDFTLIAASKAAMRGATVLKTLDDKTRQLNKHTLMAFSGEAGDTVQFAEYIQANAQLYSMRNESDLSPTALAHYVRGELAQSLRSRKPYNVNLLLGGVDPITLKPSLFWLDYLASLAPVPYAAHGYAQYYCLSILDKHHHPDISLGQGIKLLELCTDELKRRMPIDFKGMLVKAVTKDGIVDIEFNDDKIVKAA